MLSTSFALTEAVNNAMVEDSVKQTAFTLMEVYNQLDEETFQKMLFNFAANLTSVTASLVAEVFMTKEDIQKMVDETYELAMIGNAIENE